MGKGAFPHHARHDWMGGERNLAPAAVETAALHDRCLHSLQVEWQWKAEPSSKTMASSFDRLSNTYLLSNQNFLLEYMAGLASDDSDDDFNGHLLSNEEPEKTGKLSYYLHYSL